MDTFQLHHPSQLVHCQVVVTSSRATECFAMTSVHGISPCCVHRFSSVTLQTSVPFGKQGRTLGDQWAWWFCGHHGLFVPITTCVTLLRAALLITVYTALEVLQAHSTFSSPRSCWSALIFVPAVDTSKVFQLCTSPDVLPGFSRHLSFL